MADYVTSEDRVERAEWERRFKARIVERLRPSGRDDLQPAEQWTAQEAESAAQGEFDSVEFEELSNGFENNPEECADKCLSYWSE